jgi:hypothetical protein
MSTYGSNALAPNRSLPNPLYELFGFTNSNTSLRFNQIVKKRHSTLAVTREPSAARTRRDAMAKTRGQSPRSHNAHASRNGQDLGVVTRSVERSASSGGARVPRARARRYRRVASIGFLTPLCKRLNLLGELMNLVVTGDVGLDEATRWFGF